MSGVLCYGDPVNLQCELSVMEKWRRTCSIDLQGHTILTVAPLLTPKVVADWPLRHLIDSAYMLVYNIQVHFWVTRITSYNCEKLLRKRTPAHSVQCAAIQLR